MNREYSNPIARQGDFADPFVLRYNGRYYLYATNPDIRCFSSDNLVDWKREGAVIEEGTFADLVPFAPEVVYADGKFYMYTSPSGFGHYVLESDSPTGPFRKISGNIGHAIDGSVFIDDDGKWYFYWAGDEGIWGCEMLSPTEFGEPVLTGADLHGWTEGPMVVKSGDIYYMTYTGNHYLSPGYRIQTAWSRHPLTGYQDDLYNPAVIHTTGKGVGLGHSSTVTGPDLVSHYIVYHNMNPDASRDLNIDRIFWHGEATQVLGPTRYPQPAPALPDLSFPVPEGVSFCGPGEYKPAGEERFEGDFTAEMHVLLKESTGEAGPGGCGIRFDREDGTSFTIEFSGNRSGSEGSISFYKSRIKNGTAVKQLLEKAVWQRMKLHDVLHCVRIQRDENHIQIFLDGRKMIISEEEMGTVTIGYFSEKEELGIGYTAVTRATVRSASEGAVIPAECSFMPAVGRGSGRKDEKGRVILEEGTDVAFCIKPEESGVYILCLTVKDPSGGKIHVRVNGRAGEECVCDTGLIRLAVRLEEGINRLTLAGISGRSVIERIHLPAWKKEYETVEKRDVSIDHCGKLLFEDSEGEDCRIEAEFAVTDQEEGGSAGILLRVSEPAEGGEGMDTVLGIHFFKGYSVCVNGEKLVVSKHCYDKKKLGETDFLLRPGQVCRLLITIQGNEITVSRRDSRELIRVTDESPLVRGCCGIWAEKAALHVTRMQNTNTAGIAGGRRTDERQADHE